MTNIVYSRGSHNDEQIFTNTTQQQLLLGGEPAVSLGKLLASYGYTDSAKHLKNFGLTTYDSGKQFRIVHTERSPYNGMLTGFDFPKASDYFPEPHIKQVDCYYEIVSDSSLYHSAEVGGMSHHPSIKTSISYVENMDNTDTTLFIGDLLAPLLIKSFYLKEEFNIHNMRIGIIGRYNKDSDTRLIFPIYERGDNKFSTYAVFNGQDFNPHTGKPYLEFIISTTNPLSLYDTLTEDKIEGLSNLSQSTNIVEKLRVM